MVFASAPDPQPGVFGGPGAPQNEAPHMPVAGALGRSRRPCNYSILRNSASRPEIGLPGRISAVFCSRTHQNRPSGRPKAVRRANFDVIPVGIRPNAYPKDRTSGPEALLLSIGYPFVAPRAAARRRSATIKKKHA